VPEADVMDAADTKGFVSNESAPVSRSVSVVLRSVRDALASIVR